jgi:ammonia channel protein AmtB
MHRRIIRTTGKGCEQGDINDDQDKKLGRRQNGKIACDAKFEHLFLWNDCWPRTLIWIKVSLDVFGVHGVGGMLGILATGICAYARLSSGAVRAGFHQLEIQAIGMAATFLYCGAVTLVLLKLVDLTVGLRVTSAQELEGLDHALHGESL